MRDPTYIYDMSIDGEYDAPADLVAYDSRIRYEGLDFPESGLAGNGHGVEDGRSAFMSGFPFTGPEGIWPDTAVDEWVEIELPQEVLDAFAAGGEGAVASPSQSLQILQEELVEVEDLGDEEVRGVPTGHLSAQLPLPDEAVALLEGAGLEPNPLSVEVWVDEGGRARRISTTGDFGAQSVQSSFEYFDFGREVEIEVPEDATSADDLGPPTPLSTPEEAAIMDEDFTFEPPPGLSPEALQLWEELSGMTPTELYESDCTAYESNPELLEVCGFFIGRGPGW